MAKISFPGHSKCTETPFQEPSTTATAMKTSLKSELAQPHFIALILSCLIQMLANFFGVEF